MIRVRVTAEVFERHLVKGAGLPAMRIIEGLPEGAVLNSMEWNWRDRVVVLYFEHPLSSQYKTVDQTVVVSTREEDVGPRGVR